MARFRVTVASHAAIEPPWNERRRSGFDSKRQKTSWITVSRSAGTSTCRIAASTTSKLSR